MFVRPRVVVWFQSDFWLNVTFTVDEKYFFLKFHAAPSEYSEAVFSPFFIVESQPAVSFMQRDFPNEAPASAENSCLVSSVLSEDG